MDAVWVENGWMGFQWTWYSMFYIKHLRLYQSVWVEQYYYIFAGMVNKCCFNHFRATSGGCCYSKLLILLRSILDQSSGNCSWELNSVLVRDHVKSSTWDEKRNSFRLGGGGQKSISFLVPWLSHKINIVLLSCLFDRVFAQKCIISLCLSLIHHISCLLCLTE